MSRKVVLAMLAIVALSLVGCSAGAQIDHTERPSTLLQAGEVQWMEISPSMSVTTYVDDAASIKEVTALLNSADLTSVSATQVEQADMNFDLIINGNTYSRITTLEFVGANSTEIFSVLLYGDYIKFDNHYYTPATPVTDEFITIFDKIIAQGLGKSAPETIPE